MIQLPQVKSTLLRDADLLNRELTNWQIDSTQLGHGQFHLETRRIVYSDLVVERSRQNLKKMDVYCIPTGTTSLSLFKPGSAPGFWCGFEIPENTLVVDRCRRESFAVLPAGFEHVTISIDTALLTMWDLLPPHFGDSQVNPGRSIIPLTDLHGTQFRKWLFSSIRQPSMQRMAVNRDSSVEFREKLRLGLTRLVDEGLELQGGRTRRFRPRQQFSLVNRACAILRDKLTEATTTESLARDLGANVRSVQRAFAGVLGLTPHRYIEISRLRATRRVLCDSPRSQTTVSQVALANGFTELGRFSVRYRQLFGESPSETLRTGTRLFRPGTQT